MPRTRLSITALPGRNYAAFQPKDFWDPDSPRPADISFTALSVTATPGRQYNFEPRSKIDQRFTELSVIAVPGRQHTFLAKSPAVPPAGRPPGIFTQLSVVALPGKRFAFLAKAEAPIVVPDVTKKFSLHGADQQRHALLLRDDEEILEFIVTITTAGLLEQ